MTPLVALLSFVLSAEAASDESWRCGETVACLVQTMERIEKLDALLRREDRPKAPTWRRRVLERRLKALHRQAAALRLAGVNDASTGRVLTRPTSQPSPAKVPERRPEPTQGQESNPTIVAPIYPVVVPSMHTLRIPWKPKGQRLHPKAKPRYRPNTKSQRFAEPSPYARRLRRRR